ncbi:MAG: hypothetical protein NC093_05020 [Alistipes sp.]|nr:hypothetical protein [Alistipes sp.]
MIFVFSERSRGVLGKKSEKFIKISQDSMTVFPSWGKTPSEKQLDSIMPWSAMLPETCHRTYNQIVEKEAEVK